MFYTRRCKHSFGAVINSHSDLNKKIKMKTIKFLCRSPFELMFHFFIGVVRTQTYRKLKTKIDVMQIKRVLILENYVTI